TAHVGTHYQPTTGTLQFAGTAGETHQISVPVTGDTLVELNENFLVNLSNIQAGGRDVTFADAQGQATIVNDDAADLSINDVTIAEWNSGPTLANITVPVDAAVA